MIRYWWHDGALWSTAWFPGVLVVIDRAKAVSWLEGTLAWDRGGRRW